MDKKKIFKIILLYLKSNAIEEASVTVNYYGGFDNLQHSTINDDNSGRSLKIIKEFEKWIDDYIEKFDTDVFDEDDVNGGALEFKIDTNKKTLSVIIRMFITTTSDSSSEVDFEDIGIDEEILSDYKDSTKVKIWYSGGGDSGQIETMQIDDVDAELDGRIEDIGYNLLSDYGGWEINEGSQGNIVFDFKNKTVTVNHEWNNETYEEEIIETFNLI